MKPGSVRARRVNIHAIVVATDATDGRGHRPPRVLRVSDEAAEANERELEAARARVRARIEGRT